FVGFILGRGGYGWLYLGWGVGAMLVYTALAFVSGDEQVRLVGASAAIMGLLGAIVAILLRGWWGEGSAIAAQRLKMFLGIIVLQLTVDFFIPEVSGLAHGLGLIWGFTLGSLLLMRSA
ncbi:MAG: rhomboid family intramembrane serine protease, partial [Spirulina sp. DLM2.Bin59]